MEDIYERVPEHLKCPICFGIPKDKVFQCQNGHTFCEPCYKKFPNNPTQPNPTRCPQCRVVLPKVPIRNRVAEETLDTLKLEFPCQFHGEGCEMKLNRKDIARHSSSCKFDFKKFGNLRNVCSLFGFGNCLFAFNRANTDEALDHFKSVHKMRSLKALLSNQFTVDYEDVKDIYNLKETIVFTPLIFDQRWWGYNLIYVVVTRFNPVDKNLQFIPFHLINGWDGTSVTPQNTVPEPIEFKLGHSGGIVLSPHILNLLNCEGRTLNDFGHYTAPIRDLFDVDKPGTFSSTLQIKFSHPNNNCRPPPNSQMGGVERSTAYRFGDVLNPILRDERGSTNIRQVCCVGISLNWNEFQWIPYKDYKDCKNRFSPASACFQFNVLICRAKINEEWLAGCIKIDLLMNLHTPAIFDSPNLLNANQTLSLEENFEVLYLPPESFEWVPWTDLKDKEPMAIPVHEEKLDLLICESRRAPGVSFIGTIQRDMNPDVQANVYVLLSKFN